VAEWVRQQRHHYTLLGIAYSASVYRDTSKEFWWYGINGSPRDFRRAPTKEYAQMWARQALERAEADFKLDADLLAQAEYEGMD
jgi:hypothetical protein